MRMHSANSQTILNPNVVVCLVFDLVGDSLLFASEYQFVKTCSWPRLSSNIAMPRMPEVPHRRQSKITYPGSDAKILLNAVLSAS